MAALDDPIDRLYQIDLEAFVAERNALAKSSGRADVKSLQKPSVPAWAVNQLYWRHRGLFDRLVQAAEAMRDAHRRALSGKAADIRSAEATHREAVREAVAAARKVLEGAGDPVTPATLEAVTRTLEALPAPEANGRLVRPLAPAGFEALAGLAARPTPPARRIVPPRKDPPPAPSRSPAPAGADRTPPRAQAAREAKAEAERERKAEAERAAKARAEREAAERRERDEERRAAQEALDAAHEALQLAEAAVADAEKTLTARRAEREAARVAHKNAARELERL